ncbi:hypothetical protein ACFFIS_06775 [Virgibacillus soli]|uniref:Uncharacterized protein n=1 Tax=Paracerasibacillus soli TaxID=480284 RepID=A0ABU5CPA3_9BACI|nr:hypothetical protein [Virgibacillus soli]MDY0407654.1 hypothetical protein [Virgibacillus soli]
MLNGIIQVLMYIGFFIGGLVIIGIIYVLVEGIKKLFPNHEEKEDSILMTGMFFTPIIIIGIIGVTILFSVIFDGSSVDQEYDSYETYDEYGDDSPGIHYGEPYPRSDGTPVKGHYRSNPDGSPYNNLNP